VLFGTVLGSILAGFLSYPSTSLQWDYDSARFSLEALRWIAIGFACWLVWSFALGVRPRSLSGVLLTYGFTAILFGMIFEPAVLRLVRMLPPNPRIDDDWIGPTFIWPFFFLPSLFFRGGGIGLLAWSVSRPDRDTPNPASTAP
jgi:hypothetical protein